MKTENTDLKQIMEFMTMMSQDNCLDLFFEMASKEPEETYPHQRLGNGYELRDIELFTKDGKNVIENKNRYGHLYHNGLKISDEIFRKGGICNGFKDGYCALIHHTLSEDLKKSSERFSFGTHVIINELGDICLSKDGLDCPSHVGGHIASIGNCLYDLRSGEMIAPKSSTMIVTKQYVIIEHRYDWYKDVVLPLGVYLIDINTVEMIKIDDVKK
jgi:hypothetical protein